MNGRSCCRTSERLRLFSRQGYVARLHYCTVTALFRFYFAEKASCVKAQQSPISLFVFFS